MPATTADFDAKARKWGIGAEPYDVAVSASAFSLDAKIAVKVKAADLEP
jgi:hypothetical protein